MSKLGRIIGKLDPFQKICAIAFFIFALFGALFSVKAVLKIDPLKAIGA